MDSSYAASPMASTRRKLTTHGEELQLARLQGCYATGGTVTQKLGPGTLYAEMYDCSYKSRISSQVHAVQAYDNGRGPHAILTV